MSNHIDVNKIKNIVFDVGGILIGFRWKEMFADHGVDKETAIKIGTSFFENPGWVKLDEGTLNVKELTDIVCSEHPEIEEDARWFMDNVIQMRKLRPKVTEEVKRLKEKGYKLYILSNYGHELFEIHTGDLEFRQLMDGTVVSYMINEVKPNRGIYEYLINTYSLNGSESVFFDDRLDNVEGARKCGLNAVHIEGASEELLLEWLSKF